MAGTTPFFSLSFFDWTDVLSSPLNVSLEVSRFVLIDRQLYAYFSVFGNGVISGWTVSSDGGLGVNISPGVGIVESIALESTTVFDLTPLQPNSSGYIYVQINTASVLDSTPNFIFTTTILFDGSILLANVTTTGSAISAVDNTVRTQIGFKQIIDQEIASIRHNGIQAPKIDLTQEVQGQLPMMNIANFDASKITSGLLPNSVIPTIDHTTLTNIGTLTHPQLDSFAQSIQQNNVSLFGEIATINLMKLVLALKYQDANIDQFFENMLCIIPGISSDSFIDYENSNAIINKQSNCISGLPSLTVGDITVTGDQQGASTGTSNGLQIITISWDTDQDFQLASAISNLTISNGVFLSPDTVASFIVDQFNSGVAGATDNLYIGKLQAINTVAVTYDTNTAQGPLAGRFEIQHSESGTFTRTFAQPQNWSSYDTLNVLVQSSNASHASVTITLFDNTNTSIFSALLLGTNEVTTSEVGADNGFVTKTFSISGVTRTNVAAIQFSTGSVNNNDEFFLVNSISLTSQQFLLPQGNIKLRYNTNSNVVFNSIDYEATIPVGTSLNVRARTANSLPELAIAPYTALLTSGESIGATGTNIEIDITFLADPTLQLTPLLSAVNLTILVPAEQSGFTINTSSQWQQGTLTNISVAANGVMSMTETNVGDIYFINGVSVNELGPTFLPVAGVTSNNMPIAPYQGWAAVTPSAQVPDEYNPGREFLLGLYNPRSVIRLIGGTFLIADTGNDRIMEFANDGTFIRGYASNNNQYDTTLYALTSNYNPRLGVLFITFSMNLDIKYVDLTQITLNINGNNITLSNSVDLVRNVGTGEVVDRPDLTAFLDGTAGNFSGIGDNILSIILSSDKQSLIAANTSETILVRITGNPSPDSPISLTSGNLGGIECFVGDYMYFGKGGIWRPIIAIETEEGSLLYCNAIINGDSSTPPPGVISITEVSEQIGSTVNGTSLGADFVNSVIAFSDIMLGSAVYFTTSTNSGQEERKLLIAGLMSNGTISNTSSSSSGGTNSGLTGQQLLSQYIGQTVVLNMGSNLIEWSYTSPDGSYPSSAYFDDNGNVVVAESSLTAQAGRIVTVDPANGIIINLIDDGLYTDIWAIRSLPGGNIFVST